MFGNDFSFSPKKVSVGWLLDWSQTGSRKRLCVTHQQIKEMFFFCTQNFNTVRNSFFFVLSFFLFSGECVLPRIDGVQIVKPTEAIVISRTYKYLGGVFLSPDDANTLEKILEKKTNKQKKKKTHPEQRLFPQQKFFFKAVDDWEKIRSVGLFLLFLLPLTWRLRRESRLLNGLTAWSSWTLQQSALH